VNLQKLLGKIATTLMYVNELRATSLPKCWCASPSGVLSTSPIETTIGGR